MKVLNIILVLLLHKYEAIDIPPDYRPRVMELPAMRPTLYDPENEMYEDIDAYTKSNKFFDNVEYINVSERRTMPPSRRKPARSHKSCGIETVSYVPNFTYRIEMFPWMGVLRFPIGRNERFITTVVLVARCLVVASAMEIHNLPKLKFRILSRVVLGSDCNGPGIRIVDYTFHPHYKRGTYSALTLIQLNAVDYNKRKDIRPICGPPAKMNDLQSYAMVMNTDCTNSTIGVYKMEYVPMKICEDFYKTNGLDVKTIWPIYTVCTRSLTMDDCMWKEGTILAVKEEGRWRLLGFGVNGPGCGLPSRYIDYGVYHRWILSNIERFGRPSFTRRAPNQVVLRKTSGMQRYGACDAGEVITELFTDQTTIDYNYFWEKRPDTVDYNMSIFTNIDYSCIMFKALYYHSMFIAKQRQPKVEIKYYCLTPSPVCWQTGLERIDFVVRIIFKGRIEFKMAAYGRERKVIDQKDIFKYVNHRTTFPEIPSIFNV